MLMDRTQFDAGADGAVLKAKEMNKVISDTGSESALKLSKVFESSTSSVGNMLKSIGNYGQQMGIPLAGSFTKMGTAMEEAKVKGEGLKALMVGIGGLTLALGAAALIGGGMEAFKMWDEQSKALTALQQALKNTGQSYKEVTPAINAAYHAGQELGYNETEITDTLATFEVATKNTTKSMSDLALAENIAAARHESLSTATASMTSMLAGSSRTLRQFGINIDVSSGHVHSLIQAQQQLTQASENLTAVNEKIAGGFMTGITASSALVSAHERVKVATYNVGIAAHSTQIILDTLSQRFAGDAAAKAKTYAGQIDIARASMHNFGIEAGEKVEDVLKALTLVFGNLLSVLMSCKPLLVGLAVIIGGVLTLAVAMFTKNAMVGFVEWMGRGGQSADQAAAKTAKAAAKIASSMQGAADSVKTSTTEMEGAFFSEGEAAEAAAAKIGAVGEASAAAAPEIAAAGTAAGAAGPGFMSMTGALSPLTLGLGAAAFAAVSLIKVWADLRSASAQASLSEATATTSQSTSAQNAVGSRNKAAMDAMLQQQEEKFKVQGGYGHGETIAGQGTRYERVNAATTESAAAFATNAIIRMLKQGLTRAGGGNETLGEGITIRQASMLAHEDAMKLQDIQNAANAKAAARNDNATGEVNGVPFAANPEATKGESMISSMQGAIANSTISSLQTATSSVMKSKMDDLVHTLDTEHNKKLTALAEQLTATWREELSALSAELADQQREALAAQTTTMTDLITNMTQMITDQFSLSATKMTDSSKIVSDTLGERGLYGLNLVAQRMTVGLDKITLAQDTIVGSAQQQLDTVTTTQQQLVDNAQAALTAHQGDSKKIVDYYQSIYDQVSAAAKQAEAQAGMILARAQGNAKVAEAQQQALIAIEQAKANTEFAGSGVHIEITGINPTDAAAVASAISWHMRTKVAK
jgi:hypothetical protein